jgi:hypothetical protein
MPALKARPVTEDMFTRELNRQLSRQLAEQIAGVTCEEHMKQPTDAWVDYDTESHTAQSGFEVCCDGLREKVVRRLEAVDDERARNAGLN